VIRTVQWVGSRQATKILGVSNRTLMRWVRQGVVKGWKPRGRRYWRFRLDELYSAMERGN